MILAQLLAALLALSTPVALAAPARPAATPPSPSAPSTALLLVPLPRSIKFGPGSCPRRGEVRIAASGAEDAFAASLLAEEIAQSAGGHVRVVEGTDGEIVLARDVALAEGDEG